MIKLSSGFKSLFCLYFIKKYFLNGVFNSGHETTQDIKRLNFSLSQSNEIGQYFYTRLDILVYCTFVVRAVNCEVNPLESLFHFQYFA